MLSLTGRLLVATPALGDPNFHRTVIVLLDHDEDGALGVVLNRPSPVPVGEVLPTWAESASEPGVLFQGGPVSQESAVGLALLHSPPGTEDEPDGFRRVRGTLGLVDLDGEPALLDGSLGGVRIFAGYAGWGAGQLEGELAEGAWYVVDAEPGDIFESAPEVLWRKVLRRQPGDLALVATYPEDPSLN
jgi:putative transcriptional regulator